MSYDIRIWSINRAGLRETLLHKEGWEVQNDFACYSKKDWQIVVDEPAGVENEDIPDEVSSLLPGVRYVTEIALEPIHAPASARTLLDKAARSVAKSLIGVVEDPQEGTLSLPKGMKKYTPVKREHEQRFSILEMSWWFGDRSIQSLLRQIVDDFEHKLPEALPRRYGEYEPPRFRYRETGKQHLLQFLTEHAFDFVVWYPSKPVMSVSTSFTEECGFRRHGGKDRFKTNTFQISFDSSALSQPGWREHLVTVFKDISRYLQPFYGEARTLHNFISGKATYYSDMETEKHPVQGPWWTGIPQELGQAVVVGEPYLALWPQMREKGEVLGGLRFVSTKDWTEEEDVNAAIGDPPQETAQLRRSRWIEALGGGKTLDYCDEYPRVFPFREKG